MKATTFFEKIGSGEAKVLTLETAKTLVGKKINWSYFPYKHNEKVVFSSTVAEIISEFDYYKREPMEGYESRADYWEKSMTSKRLQETKDRLVIIDADGSNTYIFCDKQGFFDEPTFACSDADREVYFIEAE